MRPDPLSKNINNSHTAESKTMSNGNLSRIDAHRTNTGRWAVVQNVGTATILLGESTKAGRKAAIYEVVRQPRVARQIERNDARACEQIEAQASAAIMDGAL